MAVLNTNLILDSLSPATRSAFLARLQPVTLPHGTVLFEPEEDPQYGHFLTSGIASIVTMMEGGGQVEVGISGREGLPESLHLLGPQRVPTRCMMQVSGTALRIGFRALQQDFAQYADLQALLLRHVQYQTLVLAQLAACNRLHEVEERLARWLVMVEARINEPLIRITHEFLGDMLGTRRSTVTLVAGVLQRSGLIEHSRGQVRILDQQGLEDVACECFGVTQKLLLNLYK